MEIILCDDEPYILDQLESLIKANLSENIVAFNIDFCTSGEELMGLFDKKAYDVIFLDIEMGKLNGMETARRLREKSKDVIIVFMTNHKEYLFEGYEVQAFRYLMKGQPDDYYKKHLSAVFKEFGSRRKTINVATKNMNINLLLSDICYFEVSLRKVTLHTLQGNQYVYTKALTKVGEELREFEFVKSHQSFLVNLANIEYISKEFLLMKNGSKVPISRNYRKELNFSYTQYYSGGSL